MINKKSARTAIFKDIDEYRSQSLGRLPGIRTKEEQAG